MRTPVVFVGGGVIVLSGCTLAGPASPFLRLLAPALVTLLLGPRDRG